MDTNEQLKHDLAALIRERNVARANHDYEQVVLLTLDIAQVRRQMVELQRAEA